MDKNTSQLENSIDNRLTGVQINVVIVTSPYSNLSMQTNAYKLHMPLL